ncbi:bacitracin resistance protein BacA [Leptospira sp. 96542]|nr:bacitracin resistance protein BacA [Leptospira sp. 96542]
MENDEIYTPDLPPQEVNPNLRLLFQKWGEDNIRKLVQNFYGKISESEIKSMFPKDLTFAIEKQADFLIQILGGPSYYLQKWGQARMRMRHFAFPISEKERLVWLNCYDVAIQEFPFAHEDKIDFLYFLDQFSQWMVNRR